MTPNDTNSNMNTLKVSVSLDGLRRNATRAYNEISTFLNESQLEDWQKQEIEEAMDDLRMALATLNACSMPECSEFNDMSDKLSFVDFYPHEND